MPQTDGKDRAVEFSNERQEQLVLAFEGEDRVKYVTYSAHGQGATVHLQEGIHWTSMYTNLALEHGFVVSGFSPEGDVDARLSPIETELEMQVSQR